MVQVMYLGVRENHLYKRHTGHEPSSEREGPMKIPNTTSGYTRRFSLLFPIFVILKISAVL